MLKKIKKSWRQSKNFHASFLACLSVAYLFGIYLSQLLDQTQLPTWNPNCIRAIVLTIVLIIMLIIAFKWGMSKLDDLKDKQTFYDNFFMSIMIVVISTVLVLYNPFFRNGFNWIYGLFGILIIYFPLNWLYIQLRPK